MESKGGGLPVLEVRLLRGTCGARRVFIGRLDNPCQKCRAFAARGLLPCLLPRAVRCQGGGGGLDHEGSIVPGAAAGGVPTATDDDVLVSLWSPSGIADAALHTVTGTENFVTMSRKTAVKPAILHRAINLRSTPSGERQEWLCALCGAASCAFFVGFDAAPPGSATKWVADIFPHCDDQVCRKHAETEAGKRAGGDPDGLGEGSFCTACRTTSSESARGMQRCGRCKVARYCSAECQKADWPRHKAACVPRDAAK